MLKVVRKTPVPEPVENSPTPKRSGTRNALTLMVGTLGSRVSGFLRQSLLNQLFSTEITDAFLVALRVPNLFRELLAEGALTNSFVPVYKSLSRQEARRLSGALLGLLAVANGGLLLLAFAAAPWIVNLLVSSGANVNVELAIRLTRLVFPFLAAISFSALAMGILQAEERFLAPAWAPVALNLVTIAGMLLYPERANALAVAFVLGGVAQLLVQLPALLRWGVLPRVGALWHPKLAAVLTLMIPFTFTTGGRQVLNVVATNVLTGISEGAVTAFYNADLFLSLALGLFSISPALAFYSRLSDDAVNHPDAFAGTLLSGLKLIALLSVPAGFALFFLAEPAVQTVFNWITAFDPTGGTGALVITLSAAALAPLGFAVFPIGLSNLLVRTFYVRQRVRTPIVVTLLFLSLQMLLYVVLARRYGIAGMAWATVIAGWVQFLLLFVLVARAEPLDVGEFVRHSLKIWLAGALAVGAMLLVLNLVPLPLGWWGFVGRAVLGGAVLSLSYVGLCALFGVSEVRGLFARLRS